MPITDDIQTICQALTQSEACAIPTETVYGLAADARNDNAIAKVYAYKQRPKNHPVIVHIGKAEDIHQFARDISSHTQQLIEAFWPGPLTLIVNKNSLVSDHITAGQDTVAIRCPAHPLMQQLLQTFDNALIAPSANPFGKLSPTCAQHVLDYFPDLWILDGGTCDVGIESTIVDARTAPVRILRQGMLDRDTLSHAIDTEIVTTIDKHSPVTPGSLPSHYAPNTPLILLEHTELDLYLKQLNDETIVILHQHALETRYAHHQLPDNAKDYAKVLYQVLHDCDKQAFSQIILVKPQTSVAWAGILDRLERAAYRS